MSKQQHLQKLAIAVLAGSALTAWQLDHTANAAVKPTQVTSQLDSQKQVNVILKKDGQTFADFWIKGKPGEEAKLEIGELSRDYLWQNGDHMEKMPPRLTIPTKKQTIVLTVVSRKDKREVTKDVFLTIEHCDLKGRPLSGCEDEHYHYQVTTSYVYDLYGKQNQNIQYKLSGVTEIVPQTIASYQLAMPGRVKLSPDGLIGNPEKRVVFLDETTPFKLTIRANYFKLADDKHDQQSSERPADAEKEQENQKEDQHSAGSAIERDQSADKDSSKDEQAKDPQEPSTEQPVDTPKDQDAADDKQDPSTDQPTNTPTEKSEDQPDEAPSADQPEKPQPDDEGPSENQGEKDQQEPSTDQAAGKSEDQPIDEGSSVDQPDKDQEKPLADQPAKDQSDDEVPSESQHEQDQQEPSTDHPVDTPTDSHDQDSANEPGGSDPVRPSTRPDDQTPSTLPDQQEEPIPDLPAGQPTDEDTSTEQQEKDQQEPSTDQPADVPDDKVANNPLEKDPSVDQPAKDQPGDEGLPKDQQEKDQQEASSDHPESDPTDKSENQVNDGNSSADQQPTDDHPVDTPADSHDQQTAEKQEDSTPDPSTPPADQGGQSNPPTLHEHQEQPQPNLPAEQPVGDHQQPTLPAEPTQPEVVEDNQPALPKKEFNQQPPSTNGAADQQNDDERQEGHGEAKPDQDRLVNRKKTADNYLSDEQEKINELDRQVPPQSANDQLPQTGDNEQGRLIAAISGLLTGLTGLVGAFFAWRKN